MRAKRSLWASLISLFACIACQNTQDCPLSWDKYNQHCYNFMFHPLRTYIEAKTACQIDGATLVSVNDDLEHQFIVNWFAQFDVDKQSEWMTSGVDRGGVYGWEGDGTDFLNGSFWISDPPPDRDETKSHLVYGYSGSKGGFAWNWGTKDQRMCYICEISLKEAFRIDRPLRDYEYGLDYKDQSTVTKGPRFTLKPVSIVITGVEKQTHLECAASANPPPSYRWYKISDDKSTKNEVSSSTDARYTLTNGRLTFTNPNPFTDTGDYQCVAENALGSIMSVYVSIIRGFLDDFFGDTPSPVRTKLYRGTYLNCNTPAHSPKVVYQWYKTDTAHFIRPSLNPHTFMSENGNLYFSEVQSSDQGIYHCLIILAAPFGERLASNQVPSWTSPDMALEVNGEDSNDFVPEIHNDFPAVFPSPPQRGQDVRIECFAYGRLPLRYSWKYNDGPIPSECHLENLNRVLIIPNAQLEHSGTYTCSVGREGASTHSKGTYLSIISEPYFQFPLTNKFIDKDSQLTWRCGALAVPLAKYTWYKNTKPLASVPGDIEIFRNILIIRKADPQRHNGMYQCAAENRYGKKFSSAELRVLVIKPSFKDQSIQQTQRGTQGGNITLHCSPEAAPAPEITWSKDDADLGLTVGSEGHQTLLHTGNLRITGLTDGDEGKYTCTATNSEGTASSSIHLSLTSSAVITTPPTDTKVIVNNTAFLYCEASHDATVDRVYVWKFYGHEIDIASSPEYVKGVRNAQLGLYIRNAQFKHAGRYTCMTVTAGRTDQAEATLTVVGPPGEPAGVYSHKTIGNVVQLRWTPPPNHMDPVQYYIIEAINNYDSTWRNVVNDLHEESAQLEDDTTKRGSDVAGLGAGILCSFRVSASNGFGWGHPSLPSKWYHLQSAAPSKPPAFVNGGGGKVGTLKVTWVPLAKSDHGGLGLKYKVYWRRQGTSNGIWMSHVVTDSDCEFVTVVGPDYYYLQYEVMVQAFNNHGYGPNSTVATIFSAESLPMIYPDNTNSAGQNATAAIAYWDPLPDTREAVNGHILGYQINYWVIGMTETQNNARFVRHYGQKSEGWIIGLTANMDYYSTVQVFNGAGLGPPSAPWFFSSNGLPPILYPEFVNVTSHGPDSVYITWRGVSTTINEDVLTGFKIRYWKASSDMNTATDVEVEKVFSAVITGIKKNEVYKLRMMGVSSGGDGKKSPPVYFTLGGSIRKSLIDPRTTELVLSGHRMQASFLGIFFCTVISWCL